MATVTAPIILDSTGQQIVTKLQSIADNVKPTADEIKRTSSNNQTVEAALVSLNSQLTGAITWLNGTSQELSNCSAYNDVGLVTWQRGKLVIIAMNVSGLTANSRTKIATLPSGLRPLMDATFFGGAGLSYSNKTIITIRSNGEVYVLSDDNYANGYFLFYAA